LEEKIKNIPVIQELSEIFGNLEEIQKISDLYLGISSDKVIFTTSDTSD
jgi:hypothetical protein